MLSFNCNLFVSDELSRQLVNAVQDLSQRCVEECAKRYNFDSEEAVRYLGLNSVKLERKSVGKSKVLKSSKEVVVKAAFPLPYCGELVEGNCYALRQNNGLYTQCTGLRKVECNFCKGCASQMQKSGAEVPEYGTIQQRMEVGILEYVDPKGRKPVAYSKVMKKYKISKEQVVEEAGKYNINVLDIHFVEPEESKRGRPSSKMDKEPKAKGLKGRPKKEKKVLQIEGDEEDLFASLVAEANMEDDAEIVAKKGKSDEEKELKRIAKAEKDVKLAAEKAEKEAKLAAEKAEKEAKLAAEKAEKEAKKEQERLAREAKKQAEEDEKIAKRQALEQAKAEKEAKKSKSTTVAKKAVEEEEEEEEPDVVKKIEYEGKKYLKSKKTGIIYDYTEYVNNSEQVVIGKWNDATNKIDFQDAEESEEEYD